MADNQTPAVDEVEKPVAGQAESEKAAVEEQAPATDEKSQTESAAGAKVDAPKDGAPTATAEDKPTVASDAPADNNDAMEIGKAPASTADAPKDDKEHADEPKKSVESDSVEKKNGKTTERSKDMRWKSRDGKPKDGRKSDFSKLPESSDPDEIRRQVEFYFSDSNLPLDKFLFNTIGGYKNKPIPIKVIADFKRMRRFQPFSAVVEALHASEVLEVLEGDEIRRKEPLPESVGDTYTDSQKAAKYFEDKTIPRSVYVKGFAFDSEEATTQIDLEKFFDAYGTVKSLRLRRNFHQVWKGSVFVEFDSEETQQAFLALDPKPKWKDEELIIKSKKQYCDEKVQEKIESGELKAGDAWSSKGDHNRGGGRGGRGRGNQRGSGRGRGGRGGRGRGGRDRDNDRSERNLRSNNRDRDSDKKETENGSSKDAKAPESDNWKERRDDFQKSDDFRGKKRAAGDENGGQETKKAKVDDA